MELRVVVLDEVIPLSNGSGDKLSVSSGGIILLQESVGEWLLRSSSVLVVVSSEGEHSSELMPFGTEISCSISIETAEIASHEW
jgi:hypothetical protein